MSKKIYFVVCCCALLTMACVPQKKFQASEEKVAMLEDQNDQLKEENTGHQATIKEQDKSINRLTAQVQLLQDSVNLLQREQQTLQERYAELLKAQDALQKGSQAEIRKLLEQLQQNNDALQKKEDDLFLTERILNERKAAADKLEKDFQAQNKKMVALEKALRQKDSVANLLKQKVSDALLNFEGKGLTVKLDNGKVYVSMDEKLLFASGSATVDERGAEALKYLTSVLEKNPDINVLIEGHTDDVPYKGTGQLVDNWDLSCKRATSVVRLLLSGSSIQASRITAAGRAEFVPLKSAKTPEARSINRRIEVVLTPQLDEILKILEQ